MTYKEYVQEEKSLALKSFTNEDAKHLAELAMSWAMEKYSAPIAVEVNRNNNTIYYHSMSETTGNNKMWMDRKKRVVELYQNSSMAVMYFYEENGENFNEATHLPPAKYKAIGGCYPIILGEVVIGNISISGLTPIEDHEICVSALKKLKSLQGE